MRRSFKTRTFARWSRKAGVSDEVLREAIVEMTAGLVGADLGGSVFKKRVRMPGRGKRGSARVLVATKPDDHWFLLYGFGKNEQANIDDRELAALQKLASVLLSMAPAQLEQALARDEVMEIIDEADEKKSNPK